MVAIKMAPSMPLAFETQLGLETAKAPVNVSGPQIVSKGANSVPEHAMHYLEPPMLKVS
jgi:hypothetical protein